MKNFTNRFDSWQPDPLPASTNCLGSRLLFRCIGFNKTSLCSMSTAHALNILSVVYTVIGKHFSDAVLDHFHHLVSSTICISFETFLRPARDLEPQGMVLQSRPEEQDGQEEFSSSFPPQPLMRFFSPALHILRSHSLQEPQWRSEVQPQ